MSNKNIENYQIFPVPQAINYQNETLDLPSKVNIVTPHEITCDKKCPLSVSILPKLENILKQKNISFEISQAKKDCCNIILSQKDLGKKESYTLKLNDDIEIIGNDCHGIFYGVVTLGKILKQCSNQLLKCEIQDYPEIMYRGYIEGFYGYPWSHSDRIGLMEFCGEEKMNTYIYAPKDDPYHRKNWRDLYPNDKAKEIAELAEAGHRSNVNFVWTIHPGDTINLDSDEDFKSTINKLEQLYTLGVRQFGILFDDIGGIPDGKNQANYINRVDDEFIKPKKDVRPLITVGTRYCEAWGPSMEGYFKDFIETLHKDVEVMWTGAATMSNISYEQFDAPKRKIGSNKNLAVWWNYPVNDYCDAKILMGKIENLSPNLSNVSGFFSNPMNQAEASKQALFCIADHNWNTDAFDCERSFKASFKCIAPEVSDELEIFATNSCYLKDDGGVSGAFLYDESWYLKDDISSLKEALKNKKDIQPFADNLLKEFEKISCAVDTINFKCENKSLLKELKPFLNSLKYLGVAGKYSILSLKYLIQNDVQKFELNNNIAFENFLETENCKVNRLKDGASRDFVVEVGTLIIKPFIKELIDTCRVLSGIESVPIELNYDMKNIALKTLGVTVKNSSGKEVEEQAENIIKGKIAGGKWCSTEYRPSITLDLQEVKNLKQYRLINCGHPEAGETRMWNTKHAQILASQDGENFTLVDEFSDNTEDIVNRIFFDEVCARYIKLKIMEPAQISINGGGHTRIYGFELFEETYPYQSDKILPSEIEILGKDKISIKNINRGDVVKLYKNLDDKEPIMQTDEAETFMENLVLENIPTEINNNRFFIERISKNYLPSVRTSKIYK